MTAFSALVFAAVTCAPSVYGYTVSVNKGLIQNFHSDLPVFKLGPTITLPPTLLQSTLNSVSPGSQLQSTASGIIAQNGSQVVGYISPSTGATNFFAQYDTLTPATTISTAASAALFANAALFPQDDTSITSASGPTLMTVTHYNDSSANANSTDPTPLLSHVLAQRTVDVGNGVTLPVRGPGSKAVFGYGSDGTLKSLTYAWAPARKDSTVFPAKVADIHDAIVAQLQPLAAVAPYTVNTVDAWYYSGSKYLQPVFYFTASRDANKTLPAGTVEAPVKVSGYVPIGAKAVEALPDLTKPGDATPPATPPPAGQAPPSVREAKEGMVATALGYLKRAALPQIYVARYVVRNDDAGWTASANNFWTSLNAWNGKFAQFINWQYYFAYPYLFTTNKQTYINSAHVALTEVHGNWDLFTTYQNWGDVVYLSQIAADGYGGGAKGKLAYWIIHACEVIPSVIDYPSAPLTSYNIWWNIFDGLHAVVGYRTEMYINDGVTTNFASWIGQGVPVVSAWLSAVHGDSYWYGSSSPYVQTYYDSNRGINESYGRASTVYVCGHAGDLVWNVANLGRATCLQETYYQN